MKTLKTLSLICLSLLLVNTSCKKNKKPGTVRGRIMVNCTTPLPNHLVKMRTDWGGGASFVEDVNGNKEFMTDSEGYFEINYITKGGEGTLNVSGYSNVLSKIPIGEGQVLDIGEVYLNGKVNFIIKLQVNNPHTAQDTLFYYDWNYPQGAAHWIKKIPGPFVSGIIDTVYNCSFMGYPLTYNQIPELSINHYINSYQNNSDIYIQVPFCSSMYPEAIITID